MSTAPTRDEGIHRKNFSKNKLIPRNIKVTEREFLGPTKALSVKSFISVFGLERNLLRFFGDDTSLSSTTAVQI